MHCLCFSTMSRHLSPESALSSALLPNRRKQSSLAFFLSGQAQHLFRVSPHRVGLRSATIPSLAHSRVGDGGSERDEGDTLDSRLESLWVSRVEFRVGGFGAGERFARLGVQRDRAGRRRRRRRRGGGAAAEWPHVAL